jgi:hypothetical protein
VTGEEIAARVARQEHDEAVAAFPWDDYRACGGCGAAQGQPCRSLSGRIVNGRPDGVSTPITRAHVDRRRRAGR